MTNDIIVDCPKCGVQVQWSDSFPHRPFCSKRCKDSDFIDWANEENKLQSSALYQDIFSEDVDGNKLS